jgi:hypothetical protein
MVRFLVLELTNLSLDLRFDMSVTFFSCKCMRHRYAAVGTKHTTDGAMPLLKLAFEGFFLRNELPKNTSPASFRKSLQ